MRSLFFFACAGSICKVGNFLLISFWIYTLFCKKKPNTHYAHVVFSGSVVFEPIALALEYQFLVDWFLRFRLSFCFIF